MKRYKHLEEKAIVLRNKGKSLNEICQMLGKSKATVYYWLKKSDDYKAKPNIFVSKYPKAFETQKLGTLAMQKKFTKLRDDAYDEGVELYEKHYNDTNFRDFIVIYLTEGFRKTRNKVSVSNSNPNIIKISKTVMEMFSEKELSYWLQYYPDQNIKDITNIWSDKLQISPDIIKLYPKSNAGLLSVRNWNCKLGVMHVLICDTYFRSKIQAWMDIVEKEWEH